MLRKFVACCLAALVVLGFAAPSQADLILFSNLAQAYSGDVSFNNDRFGYGTDFLTDGAARTITSVTAAMDNSDNTAHGVEFSIYADNGGIPGLLVGVFDTPAIIPAFGSGTFTATSSGINLQPNSLYWLAGQTIEIERAPNVVHWHFNDGEGTDGTPFVTEPETPIIGGNTGPSQWVADTDGNLSYSLNGPEAVPEPSSLIFATIAGTCGAFSCWRRRRVAIAEQQAIRPPCRISRPGCCEVSPRSDHLEKDWSTGIGPTPPAGRIQIGPLPPAGR